jgi:tetratricopeptide (TPR) repeat protein
MAQDPAELTISVQRAVALHMGGELDRARPLYEEILAIQPRHLEVLGKLAALSIQTGNPHRAMVLLDKALAIDPGNAVNYCNRGAACEKLRQWDLALASYSQAIAIQADLAPAHCNRANVLRELQRWPEALAGYDTAIALQPNYVNAYNNRGKVWMELEEYEKALASYDAAIAIKPDFADSHYNRGVLLGKMARPDLAVVSYNHAIAINPALSAAYFNRALALLLLGEYQQGWADYEWRWRNERIALSKERRDFRQLRWTGAEPVARKTLFIYSEQGLGDTIQFSRYVLLLAERGANVIFEVQKPLFDLAHSLEGVAKIIGRGEALPRFDFHCSLMSLPLAFSTTLATIPTRIPYLRADAARISAWGQRMGQPRKLRVGLVWSSGVRPNEAHLADLNLRNIPLTTFAALKNPQVDFYSMQKGLPAESELAQMYSEKALDLPIIDMASLLNDFGDTAALIEQLDLVISVDTATAHLAGALGKPVWILACFNACWRWLQDRTDSPWYPTVRLYRQKSAGDWDEVIQRVNTDLKLLVQSSRPRGRPGQS